MSSDFELSHQDYVDKHSASLVLGIGRDEFRKQKTSWVRFAIKMFGTRRLLDFGFGAGELLDDLIALNEKVDLLGVEPSVRLREEMISRAASRVQTAAGLLEIEDGSVDLITCFNVLHHIPPAERTVITAALQRKLEMGGRLLIWEHNPFNPGTQIIVCRCEYDKDAILLRMSEVIRHFESLELEKSEYVNLSPPSLHRFKIISTFERTLRKLPLGAQYRLTMRKIK